VRACPEVPDPEHYATEDAPAPLALAASLVEATEAGARILVLDADDVPAGAFGRDARMQGVMGDTPPLEPLAGRLAELRDRWGLSFFIAARAIGGLCDVADAVFILRGDRLEDATDAVRRPTWAPTTRGGATVHGVPRRPPTRAMRVVTTCAPGKLKVAAWGGRGVRVGEDLVDLTDTTLVGDPARLRAVGALLKRAAALTSDWRPVETVLDALEAAAGREALAALEEPGLVDLVRPSRIDIASALVRWKRVSFRADADRLSATAEDPK
jgi:predicted ABC-class ATPase